MRVAVATPLVLLALSACLPKVKEMVGLGTTAIYEKMKRGEFPKQIKLGRLSGWVESEIQEWITRQIRQSRTDQPANSSPHAQAA